MKNTIKTLIIIFLVFLLAACDAGNRKDEPSSKADEQIKIVTTIFPIYDWTANIIKGNEEDLDLKQLIGSNVDLHSYQPTTQDIIAISTCDVFIYVGGESDEWVEDALKQASNQEMRVINLMEILEDRLVEEEHKEGMEEEDEEEESEEDEHVWLSLRNAKIIIRKIADVLSELDEVHSSVYENNADEYLKKLQDLDKRYEDTIDSARVKTLLFADRFPFRYLCEDYGLDYYAAFKGCSAETEASFATIRYLSEKVDELSLEAIFRIEGSSDKIAVTVRENTLNKDQEILILNSMQSQMDKDATYLSLMEDNLKEIEKGLN